MARFYHSHNAREFARARGSYAELSMIDENLCRNELSPSERASQTARRKMIFEELNPEVSHGGNIGGPSGQFVHTVKDSFAEETAKATGKDERSVRRDAERGSKVIGEVIDLITGTKLDTGTYLDKLKKLALSTACPIIRGKYAATLCDAYCHSR